MKTVASKKLMVVREEAEPTVARRVLDQSWLLAQLGYAATRVSVKLKPNFVRDLGGIRMTVVEFSLMSLLAANEDVNQKQLCEALSLSPPRLAVILDRLEERRLVRRVRSREDRRESIVNLTAAGQDLYVRARQVAVSVNAQAVAVLTPGEHALLLELLHKVAPVPQR